MIPNLAFVEHWKLLTSQNINARKLWPWSYTIQEIIAASEPKPRETNHLLIASDYGSVGWDRVTGDLELKAMPGVYVAGEMLDWDAPTGGYLLTACLATGRWAGEAVARRLRLKAMDRGGGDWLAFLDTVRTQHFETVISIEALIRLWSR